MHSEHSRCPSIVIYIAGIKLSNPLLKEITYGIEEESVPYSIDYLNNSESTLLMAYEAAHKSMYDVGIGFSQFGIILHQGCLPLFSPPIKIVGLNIRHYEARLMGINAARLLKGEKLLLPV